MTAALILTSASHTIACAHCNAPWPREVAQCPGCGRREEAHSRLATVAPLPDDLRAQLAAVTAERDAAIARADADEGALRAVALWLGGPHQSPQPDDVAAVARAKGAELDALRDAVEGRTTPPTAGEIAAHASRRGKWYVGARVGGEGLAGQDKAREWADLHRDFIARNPEGQAKYPWRWIAIDRDSRPCAWPTVTP